MGRRPDSPGHWVRVTWAGSVGPRDGGTVGQAPSAQDLGIGVTWGPVGTGLGDQKVTLISCEPQTQGWGVLVLPA